MLTSDLSVHSESKSFDGVKYSHCHILFNVSIFLFNAAYVLSELYVLHQPDDLSGVTYLSDRMYNGVVQRITQVVLKSSKQHRFPGNLTTSFSYVEGENFLMALKDVDLSSGSACTSPNREPISVLRSLGVDDDMKHTILRFGIGLFTTEKEMDYAVDLESKHV